MRWFIWICMLVLAILLIAAGFQGRFGSLLAAFFTPSMLETNEEPANNPPEQSTSASASSQTNAQLLANSNILVNTT